MQDFMFAILKTPVHLLRSYPELIPPLNIARRMTAWMVLILGYIALVCGIVSWLHLPQWKAGNELAATLGVGIGMLIGFRNNAANDRWWEARKAWGQLINDCRNLALKARAYVGDARDDNRELAGLLSDFARSLKAQVRGTAIEAGALRTAGVSREIVHLPGYFAGRVHQLLSRWQKQGLGKEVVWILDQHARVLMDVCGVCERIRSTPLPSSYRSLLRWGLVLYVVLSPWSVSLEIGWWSMPVLAIGIGLLLGMELAAEAIEEPFGSEGDDLPLDAFCKSIEDFVDSVLHVSTSTCELNRPRLHLEEPGLTVPSFDYGEMIDHPSEALPVGV